MATRPAIFKWRQTEPVLILCAVRWYLRYSLSLRDVEELLAERGRQADHTTVWRWVQRYGPELEQRIRRHLKPTPFRYDKSDRTKAYLAMDQVHRCRCSSSLARRLDAADTKHQHFVE
jgi:transposase-like protein